MDQLEIMDKHWVPLTGFFADEEAVRIFPAPEQLGVYNSTMTSVLEKSSKLYQVNAMDVLKP